MRAVTWHGKRDVRVDTVPDPGIEHPTDAIVRITSTGICGSDLHLYEVMGPFMKEGDVLVLGLGPIGEMSTRIAQQRGTENVLAVDLVPERLERARGHGVQAFDLNEHADVKGAILEAT